MLKSTSSTLHTLLKSLTLTISTIVLLYSFLTFVNVAQSSQDLPMDCGFAPFATFTVQNLEGQQYPWFFPCIVKPLEMGIKPGIGFILNPIIIFTLLWLLDLLVEKIFIKNKIKLKLPGYVVLSLIVLLFSVIIMRINSKNLNDLDSAYSFSQLNKTQELSSAACSQRYLAYYGAIEKIKDEEWLICIVPNDSIITRCIDVKKSQTGSCTGLKRICDPSLCANSKDTCSH